MDNTFLIIIAALLGFYLLFMLYVKYGYKSTSEFSPVSSSIPDVEEPPKPIPMNEEKNVYETEDTRMQYPLQPPVHPNVRNTIRKTVQPASEYLYTDQSYDSPESVLDTPPASSTNELVYSGGDTQLLQIPLQFNYPYNEQLRSQDILITPYNKIKYGKC
jgi:hypothetical protein